MIGIYLTPLHLSHYTARFILGRKDYRDDYVDLEIPYTGIAVKNSPFLAPRHHLSPPRTNPPVKGALQRNRPPHRWGLHVQLGSGRCPLPHDAACSPPPYSPGTSAPARLCRRPLCPHGGSQVAPAALLKTTDSHCGGPPGARGGEGPEDQRGGEREGEKEGGEEERKQGTEHSGGE